MQTWITELRQLGPQNLVLAIAGNKVDLESQRKVRGCAFSLLVSAMGVASSIVGVVFVCKGLHGAWLGFVRDLNGHN